jgi:uncharacterized protein YdeI (YjbR/CyaY-like superfamily)
MAGVAAVIVNPRSIQRFKDAAAFERWLARNHDKKAEVFLRIYKKTSTVPSVDHSTALDVALCWGWIDGVGKPYDDVSYLQRFTPRTSKSRWSDLNRKRVERLTAAGRMTPHGAKQIEAAKADGRWDAAYASSRGLQMPPDLLQAIEADAKAFATFKTLNRVNLYSLAYRTRILKTEAGRRKRIQTFVAMLRSGKTIHPNGPRARTKSKVDIE